TFGWVEHASFGYCLGRRALGGGGGEGNGLLREAAAPFLHELHHQTGMCVHLTGRDGPDVVYLDKVGGRFAAAIPSRVGGH
ncbi:IclR family transcriptional regulator, partial [Lysinibacillus sp. OL1]